MKSFLVPMMYEYERFFALLKSGAFRDSILIVKQRGYKARIQLEICNK